MAVQGPPPLADVEHLSPLVTRVLGLNPGSFTLTGTNTYLVGRGERRTLVDTGEGKAEYLPLLRAAMQAAKCSSLDRIVITHHHVDHVGGIAGVLQEYGPIEVCKFPHTSDAVTEQNASCRYRHLSNGDALQTEGANLKVVYTPGHTNDHVALWLEEERAVFTGDCILGYGTTKFDCLGAYMRSLALLKELQPSRLYPGHGPMLDGVRASTTIDEYIEHRAKRERMILDALADGRAQTLEDLVKTVYADTPVHLHIAAAGNLELHLGKLIDDAKVVAHADTYQITSPPPRL